MKLSNQAKWYLGGEWPVRTGVYGYADPEPTAMQELVDRGLALEVTPSCVDKKYWLLTDLGWNERNKIVRREQR